ncbi:hypothetical protein BC835DRAFT_1549977 [Cytidiella melzeri]|nr:hypothetical protein BC835DRAFT_1549977 [Cytidiella melzeri]
MSARRGMPLLSGPPPPAITQEQSCRKCNKEFNMLFARSRRCNHCGYSYCHSCSDYQALMPRGDNSGYDPMPVCAYCIESINITAAGKGQLRGLSLAKLKKYAKDYGIDVHNVVEKDDLIDRIIGARAPNGCLPPARERYYRMNAIPDRSSERPRGILSRAMQAMNAEFQSGSASPQQNSSQQQRPQAQPRPRTTSQPSSFPRPDLEPDRPYYPPPFSPPPGTAYRNMNMPRPETSYPPPQGPPPNSTYQYNTNMPQPSFPRSNPQPNIPPRRSTPTGQQARSPSHLNVPPTSTRPRSASAPRTPTNASRASSPARAPLPSLDELLSLPRSEVQTLPISTLKAVLFRNHVNASMVVEKSELVSKVQALIDDERAEREAHARREEEEEREMQEALERSRREHEQHEQAQAREREEQQVQAAEQDSPSDDASTQPPPSSPSPEPNAEAPRGKLSAKAQTMASHLERTGLCVICQDEEANIAIVDCGHLCMCRPCSDLIMNSTRECPLCRTRIITEARLLRIFKS